MSAVIYKALSGFYYVDDGGRSISCRARGRFRHEGCTPLVGDRVRYTLTGEDTGMVDEILPRRNAFQRPAVANIDQLVIVASAAIPVTDPFLIDRMTVTAILRGCTPVIWAMREMTLSSLLERSSTMTICSPAFKSSTAVCEPI